MLQHMIAARRCALKDLELSKRNHAALEELAPFVPRQNKHAGYEHDEMFNKPPHKLFSGAIALLKTFQSTEKQERAQA